LIVSGKMTSDDDRMLASKGKTKMKTTTLSVSFALALALSLSAFADSTEAPTYTTKRYPTQFATGLVRTIASQEFLRKAPHKSFDDVTPVPGSYSLQGKAGPVENQGQCGSCWDFALTTALRGAWMAGEGKDPGRLSFNYLLNCATEMDGCQGGDFPAADLFINPLGAPAYGSDGTYTASEGKCQQKPAISSAVSYKLLGSDLGAHPETPAPSFRDIAYVVGVLHKPVAVDVYADWRWQGYSHGVFNKCTSVADKDMNHMVVIEGYNCETAIDASGTCVFDADGNLPAGVGTWTIRNSWGTSWGDHGYITTKATDKNGVRCNNIATDALYFDLQ
jgi:C1A family cysteine protease